ncbi:MAG TPA: M1 family aminopeptidase, partial [Thermoanaerobaculia bacterium]|nr:M1 family aminopeptidase [Thermoanaerobaculia bacterium]
ILVLLFPVGLLLVNGFFLWNWAPTWLDPRINRLLMLFDAGGFRWLNETWLKLDRGVDFYNHSRIGLDGTFLANRILFLGLGIAGAVLAWRHLARGEEARPARRPWRLFRRKRRAAAMAALAAIGARPADGLIPALAAPSRSLAGLGMRAAAPPLLAGTWTIARAETRALFSQVGLYIFIPLILLQTLGSSLLSLGAFQTELLLTPGLLAVGALNTLSFLLCLLLMFYTVESLERERVTGLAPLFDSAPVPGAAILLGKSLANSLVGALVVAATFIGCLVALLIQGKGGMSLWPFALVWGALLFPTFLLWTTFVTAVRMVTGQRYVTYGLCLAALAFTLYRQLTNHMNWVGNWPLWDALRWSDMGTFQLDARALWLNRLLALSLAALFSAVAVAALAAVGRRQADAMGTIERFSPRSLGRSAVRLSPWAVVPILAGIALWLAVFHGFQGGVAEKQGRDYWKQNLATWKDVPLPALAAVDVDLTLEPARRWLRSRGTYELVNDQDGPLKSFAMTGGPHWRHVRWTLAGKAYKPDDRSNLWVFTPPAPLPPGGHLKVGFELDGNFPEGVTKNGGGNEEFVLPSGVVLTSFRPTFVPVLGYMEEIGRKKGENDYEPKVYADDFYVGKTPVGFGSSSAFTTRVRVTGPAEYTWNSVGTLVSDEVKNGRRTSVWQSDHPVRFWNVVGGRYAVRRGNGTAIYYYPGHAYNISAMLAALDAARRWYGEWFHPYPWRELKLTEFPNLAGYAQGFPTNISFSEGIGFLTKSDVKTNAVFLVTAHESAHQWWGNILTPGKGPGGDILSEGMAHFSTLLLMEQVLGPASRIEFAKRIEEQYGDRRRVDAERPLVKIDGQREGDTTVTYDKGGWVFWMLLNEMGRERALAGLRKFVNDWGGGPDFPVLQDFVASMRPFAPDPAAYDRFVRQWFFEVVVPEYRLEEARKAPRAGGWEATVRIKNVGTGRMPVEVAAIRGERFPEKGKKASPYREARRTVVLGAGESATVAIACPFEPERLLVDPDAKVLQLARKAAVVKL